MIKAVAIDDEPPALAIIDTFCKQYDYLSLEKAFTDTAGALKYLEKNTVDLLFLDINMPAISGMDFYKLLQQKPMLILTTSYSEYALESYNLNAVDYLLKPFTLERFGIAVTKAQQMYEMVHKVKAADASKFLMLKVDYGMVKVVLSDILFIEGLDNYLKIYLQDQPPLVVRFTMKSLAEKLNENEFVRVHRSYIVPVNRIESVKHRIIAIGNEEIPIGKIYEEQLKAILDKKSLNNL
ncbi:MAG: response regulator transcription factor [Bacteroidetes bacterium]|nr:response regulator transcription factor [Bacteroidota bacterium]